MNKLFLTVGLVGVLAAGSAFAQDRWWGRDERYAPRAVRGIVERVHADLNRAYQGWLVNRGDRRRLDAAERELREFAGAWENGRFNQRALDHAIGEIQFAVDANHMRRENREALESDLGPLREMRGAFERHEIYERRY